MSFIFHCPWCNQKFDCDDSFDGQIVVCTCCHKSITIKKTVSSNNQMFVFECIFCRQKMNVPEEAAGTRVKCAACGRMFFCVKPKSKKEKNAESIKILLAFLAVIGGFVAIVLGISSCINFLGQRSSSQFVESSGSSASISRSQVIAETRRALDMAATRVGCSYSGFTVDHCIIGTDKATCHFSLTEKGIRKTGAIEFNIRGSSLIPSGQFYLE